MKGILSLLTAAACFCGAEVAAQEKLEIQITIRDGVVQTIEVDRDIEELDFLRGSGLTSITLPEGLTKLEWLDLSHNELTSLILPDGLTNLKELRLHNNPLTSLTLPEGLTSLEELRLSRSELTNFTLPNGLTKLEWLGLSQNNRLTSLTLPNGLTSLEWLYLADNQLTNLTLPEGLTSLKYLALSGNEQLRSLTLARDTALGFKGFNRGLAYNLGVECGWSTLETHESPIFLKEVILPKRLDGKVFFYVTIHPGSVPTAFDVYDNLEFLFLEDLDLRSPRITRAGDALEITWAVGVLQTSANIEGPWKDVRASSPLRIFPRPSIPAEFFRLKPE